MRNIPFPVIVTGVSVLVALCAKIGDPFAATDAAKPRAAAKIFCLISNKKKKKPKNAEIIKKEERVSK